MGKSMWKRFLFAFAVTGAAALALALALIMLVDPLGTFPGGLDGDFSQDGLALNDRRFAAPRIIRSEDYDSFLLGTSTMHSVDPQWAEQLFGGSFANLTLHGGTPFEIAEIVRLIGHELSDVKRVVLGVDLNRWCNPKGHAKSNARAVFPDWLYDQDPVNDIGSSFNISTLESAYDQLRVLLRLKRAELPADGYRNQLNDANWNAAKAKKKIDGSDGVAVAALDPYETMHREIDGSATATFPDHKLLRDAAQELPPTVELILVIMPSHALDILNDDESERESMEQCKHSLATQISYPRVSLIDFRIPSAWTRNDANYWDRHHIRVGLAHDLVRRIKEAIDRRRDAEDGVYRYLAGPGASAATAR